VLSAPRKIFYAATKLRQKKDIQEYVESPPPFILREGRLYTFTDLNLSNAFGSAVTPAKKGASADTFSDWFSDEEYKRRAIELLNVCLRQHAWGRYLRFDGVKCRYYFSPKDGKPIRIPWKIGGRVRWREVTTGHTRREKQEDDGFKEVPFGWHDGDEQLDVETRTDLLVDERRRKNPPHVAVGGADSVPLDEPGTERSDPEVHTLLVVGARRRERTANRNRAGASSGGSHPLVREFGLWHR